MLTPESSSPVSFHRAWRRSLRWCGVWILIALSLRAGLGVASLPRLTRIYASNSFAYDGVGLYMPLAKNLLAGRGLCLADGQPRAGTMPGYPLLLAASLKVFGSDGPAVLAVQVVLGSVLVGCVFILGDLLVAPLVGHLAALIALCCPDLLIFSMINLADGPSAACLMISSVVLLLVLRTGRLFWAVVLGLGVAAGAFVRESGLVMAPVWALALLWSARGSKNRRLAMAGCVILTSLLPLVPWVARNWVVMHDFIPTTTKGGRNIYQGTLIRPFNLSSAQNDNWQPDPETAAREAAVYQRARAATNQKEVDRIFLAAAFDNIRRDPWGQLKHTARKLGWLWRPLLAPRHAARLPGVGPVLYLTAAANYVLLATGVLGLWMLRKNREFVAVVTLPFLTLVTLFTLLSEGSPNYHIAEVPALVLGAAGLIATLLTRYRHPQPALAATVEEERV